ncbi:MAG: NgoPII family restriction endonuclease, partial [Ruthenibacterium sp.]
PWKVFSYIYQRNVSADFNFMCVINTEKWNTLEHTDELLQLAETIDELEIQDVKIKNPDNPAQLINAKLIKFYK